MKIPGIEHFVVEEFLHPHIFKFCAAQSGDTWRWFVSDFQLNYAVLLRELTGAPIIVNNWHTGGRYVGRGTRPSYYRPKGGAVFSQHYFKNALDVSSRKYTPIALSQLIEDNFDKFDAIGLTTLENPRITRTWLHGDGRRRIEGLHKPGKLLIVGG